MSDALDALLGADLVDEKKVYIKRLKTHFTIQSVTGADVEKAMDQASRYVGKGAKRVKERDDTKLGALLIAKACVDPVFTDAQLLKKYNAVSADEVVLNALRAGEVAMLAEEVKELSGFGSDNEDAEEDIKNS